MSSEGSVSRALRKPSTGWLPLLAVAAAFGALAMALPRLPLSSHAALAVSNLLQLGAAALAAGVCIAVSRKRTGGARSGWLLLGLGAGSWALGQAAWTWYEVVLHVSSPIPSLADLGFLAMIPFALVAVLMLSPLTRRDWLMSAALILDGLLVMLAVFVVAWPSLLDDVFHSTGDPLEAVLAVSYPLGDIAILGLAGGILMRGRSAWRSPLGLVYAGFVFIAVADLGLAIGTFDDSYATGHYADAGWVVGFTILAAAACAPAPIRAPVGTAYGRRVGHVLPFATVLLGIAGSVFFLSSGDSPDLAWRLAMGVLVLLAMVRQALVVREYQVVVRERGAALVDLQRSRRAVQVLSKVNRAVVKAPDEAALLTDTCGLLVQDGGYRLAWIGVARDDEQRSVEPVADAGPDGYLERARITWADTPRGQGPTGRAIRSRATQVSQDILRDPKMEPWRADAKARGYASSCALFLDLGDSAGALMVYAAEPDAFGPDEVSLLEDLTSEIAFGVRALRARRAKEDAETARMETAAMYAGIVENSTDGIFQTKPDGRILFANQAAAALLGYGSPAQMLAEVPNVKALYVDPAQRTRFIDRVFAGDRLPFETAMRRRDGSTMWAALRANLLVAKDGSRQLVGTMEDRTAARQAEEARAAVAQQEAEMRRLRDLNEMRMEFLNTAAHDLKTPLTPLKLEMATLRMRGKLDPRQKQSLELMDRNLNRFQVLVEDMLDAARLQSGRLKLRRQALPIGPLVREAVASFQESARQADLTVQLDPVPDVHIDADPTKAMQVLMNLVSNAVKYTPAGGSLHIHAEADAKEVVVSVQDSGLGMTAEQLGKLFQAFVRLHEDKPGIAKGTGLGLYISKGIVEQHGGRIWAESDGPGKGSTLHVAWPLAGPGTPTSPPPPPPPPAPAAA